MLETDVRPDRATPYRRWIVACVAAETVGMTAAAGAAVLADGLSGPPALGVVVAGGLVEGTALGFAQGAVLARVAPALSRVRYLVATVVVAGLGWAAASAPFVAGDGGDAEQPPVLLVVLGALGVGLVLGAVLGAAQALSLRGVVRHPRRWVTANAAAWPLAMVLILVGAMAPGTGWPAGSVIAMGALTGAVAGAALGLVSGLFLPTLGGVGLGSGGTGAPRLLPSVGVAAGPGRTGSAGKGVGAPVPLPGNPAGCRGVRPVDWQHNSRGADRFRLGTLVPGEAGRGASVIS